MPIGDAPRTSQGYMSEASTWGGVVADAMEPVADLTWPASVLTYTRMRSDPQIAATLNAYSLPIRSGHWAVDPKGCRDEVVELVSDALGLPVVGTKDDPGPARRRGVEWDEHLRVALGHLVFGHMPFAQRYDIVDGKAKLAELSERLPSTISEILVNDDGTLKGIVQFGEDRPIPAGSLVWYVHDREGASWQGQSMLRPAYGAWLIKHEMWRVLATSSRRFGMGIPVVEAPPGATPAQLTEAAQLAQSIRVGDQGGVGLPAGFRINIAGMTGGTPDTLAFIRYLDAQIAQAVLASVLNLDASPNGSRALGETLVGLLEMSWTAVAREITGPATKLSVQITDYNFGEKEPAPRVVVTDIDRPESTAAALQALIQVGAIHPDDNLEASLRERYSLPEKAPMPVAVPGAPSVPGQPPVPAPAPTPPAPVPAPAR